MLVSEVFYRDIPNRQALARYGGLTGSPNESGQKRREKGLSRSGNPRVRNGLIQFAWRFLKFQPDQRFPIKFKLSGPAANLGARHGPAGIVRFGGTAVLFRRLPGRQNWHHREGPGMSNV